MNRLPNLDDYDEYCGDDEYVEDILTQHFGSNGYSIIDPEEEPELDDDMFDCEVIDGDALARAYLENDISGPYSGHGMRVYVIGKNHVEVCGGGVFWRSENDIAWLKSHWKLEEE